MTAQGSRGAHVMWRLEWKVFPRVRLPTRSPTPSPRLPVSIVLLCYPAQPTLSALELSTAPAAAAFSPASSSHCLPGVLSESGEHGLCLASFSSQCRPPDGRCAALEMHPGSRGTNMGGWPPTRPRSMTPHRFYEHLPPRGLIPPACCTLSPLFFVWLAAWRAPVSPILPAAIAGHPSLLP